MKTILHKAEDRGFANHDWLQATHSFSFAKFYDPKKIQFGALRVLNDDVIAPKMGFGTHPHDNMEIITIPLKGVLKHRDSMGSKWIPVIPNEVQVMSAGTGVEHSEINGSDTEHLNLFQIWIIPNKSGVEPRYDQKTFKAEDRANKLQRLVTSIDDESESETLKIHQQAAISRIDLDKGNSFEYKVKYPNNGVYVMTIYGTLEINAITLESRDALGVSETESFVLDAKEQSSVLFIEVPMR